MGNPAYDARRDAERAEAEKDKAVAEAMQAAFEALTDFMRGKAQIFVSSGPAVGIGGSPTWSVRLYRDKV
jgi:hypothetical protein